ncbi:MAG: type VI secretion system tip protein VgrG, partial [Desulfobacteraceae bacterium]
RLYEFDITLASDDGEIDLKGVLQNPATLTIKGGDQDLPIHGAVSQFEQLNEVKGHYFYRALLVPRLRQTNLYHENQLFLDKKVPDIIEEILKQAGLTTQDYELKLTRSYPQWEYICQYRETDFDFISRWMEREGIYYYFEQGEQNEKIIITDSSTAHMDIPGDAIIPYFTPSGLAPEEEAIKAFVCTQKMLPKKVILKDYNYRKPSLEIKGEAEVDSKGRGEVYIYGEHFKDPGQGNGLAKIRAEEIKCRENIFHGEGTASNMCPGFFFELEECYRDSYNRKYLILEVEHEGHQTGSMWAGMGDESAEREEKLTYSNRFSAIPSDIQFRPERKTPKPKFNGIINATVDAAGDGKNGEVDDQGRYKIILPFDQSGNKDGKASRWVRMAQPYAGSDYGMHFPLHKGAEVLLTFVDGDPDRPIISGSIPNPETISPVTSSNQTKSVVRDNFGNEMIFDATPGDEHIHIYSPHHSSGIQLGRSFKTWTDSDSESWTVGDTLEAGVGTKLEAYAGWTMEAVAGFAFEGFLGSKHEIFMGAGHEWVYGYKWDWVAGPNVTDTKSDTLLTSRHDIILGAGDEYCLLAGFQEPDRGNENKSIMRATPDGLTLSLGNKVTETGEGIGKGSWYDKQGGSELTKSLPVVSWGGEEWLATASLISGLLATLSAAGAFEHGLKKVPSGASVFGLGTAALSVGTIICDLILGMYKMRDDLIEPVRHVDPSAKVWLHRDGTVGVVSTKGGDSNKTDGENGRIVIGVNQQEEKEAKDWRYYDSYLDFNKEDTKKVAKLANIAFPTLRPHTKAAKMAALKEKSVKKSLGRGSNIVVEKNQIKLFNGEPPNKEYSTIFIDNKNEDTKGISLITRDNKKQKKWARIAVFQKTGDIRLSNDKMDGQIILKSGTKIFLKTKNIFLDTTEGTHFKKGKIKHKNFEVLK